MGKVIKLAVFAAIVWTGYKYYPQAKERLFERGSEDVNIQFTNVAHDVERNFRGKFDRFYFTAANKTGRKIVQATIWFQLTRHGEKVAEAITYLEDCPDGKRQRLRAQFRDAPDFDGYDFQVQSVKYVKPKKKKST